MIERWKQRTNGLRHTSLKWKRRKLFQYFYHHFLLSWANIPLASSGKTFPGWYGRAMHILGVAWAYKFSYITSNTENNSSCKKDVLQNRTKLTCGHFIKKFSVDKHTVLSFPFRAEFIIIRIFCTLRRLVRDSCFNAHSCIKHESKNIALLACALICPFLD